VSQHLERVWSPTPSCIRYKSLTDHERSVFITLPKHLSIKLFSRMWFFEFPPSFGKQMLSAKTQLDKDSSDLYTSFVHTCYYQVCANTALHFTLLMLRSLCYFLMF
jgi:hypothetical protein